MVESWNGTLSCDEFKVAASTFSEQWTKFNSSLPQWTWIPSRKQPWVSQSNQVGYLSLENLILPKLSEGDHNNYDEIEREDCCSEYEEEVVDTAVVVVNDGPGEHRYDLHAVYSPSYRVPVLYFRAYRSDGQPLLLDVIEKDIPLNSAEMLTRAKWTFITQQEHPELRRPWYTLHPCGTSEWMKLLLSSDDASVGKGKIPVEKYLVSWFSVVGQVFGMKLPFEMLNPAGLYRYRLGDVVKVKGFHNATPELQFVCRRNLLLTINIDKNTEKDLQLAVEAAARLVADEKLEVVDFTSCVDSSEDPGHYVVFWEVSGDPRDEVLQDCCDCLDRSFVDASYVSSRKTRAIGPLELRIVRRGTFHKILDHYVGLGAAVSQFKTPRCVGPTNATVLQILAANGDRRFFSTAF